MPVVPLITLRYSDLTDVIYGVLKAEHETCIISYDIVDLLNGRHLILFEINCAVHLIRF